MRVDATGQARLVNGIATNGGDSFGLVVGHTGTSVLVRFDPPYVGQPSGLSVLLLLHEQPQVPFHLSCSWLSRCALANPET